MTIDSEIAARLKRAEQALAKADRLLQRRRIELGGHGNIEFEDRLFQGVRELAAAVRELAAQAGQSGAVSESHAAELDAQASDLDQAGTWQGYGQRAKE